MNRIIPIAIVIFLYFLKLIYYIVLKNSNAAFIQITILPRDLLGIISFFESMDSVSIFFILKKALLLFDKGVIISLGHNCVIKQ